MSTPNANPTPTIPPTPIAVTIAGSDSGGGAGIQADLKTFSALGVYGASVITALTAQNALGVTGIHDVPPGFVAAQMDGVFSGLAVRETVAVGLDRHHLAAVVLDPVMVAASGDRLLVPEAVETLREQLLRRALLITPNLPEAAALLDEPVAETLAQARAQAERLLAYGPQAVLVKGGHGSGPTSVDVLVDAGGVVEFAATRIETRNTHGTGCTLSSAITANLARGLGLRAAVAGAKDYLTRAIAASDRLTIGHGHGPVHHFHALWKELPDSDG